MPATRGIKLFAEEYPKQVHGVLIMMSAISSAASLPYYVVTD